MRESAEVRLFTLFTSLCLGSLAGIFIEGTLH